MIDSIRFSSGINTMSTGLTKIAEKARQDKRCRFTSLAHHVTMELLQRELQRIPRSSGRGVDGLSRTDVEENGDEHLKGLIEALHRRNYRPPPVRRVLIPKPGKSEKRPIGVPTILDRVLQGAVAQVIGAVFEQDFLPTSFGGRPKLSAHHALATLQRHFQVDFGAWVFEADLKNFFGSLDHDWMLKFIEHRIEDPRIVTLIRRWLKAGVMDNGAHLETVVGTPQGGSISVVLSNVYLHFVLDLWFEKVVKPRMKGRCFLVRYLDDFVVVFQYHEDAMRFAGVLPKRLGKFGLSLEPSKTRLVRFGRFASKAARERGERTSTLKFLGFVLYMTKSAAGKFRVGFMTAKERLARFLAKLKDDMLAIRHQPVGVQQKRINQSLRGFYNYFGIGGNVLSLGRVYFVVTRMWKRILGSRSQKSALTWIEFKKLLEHFPLSRPKPRIRSMEMFRYVVL